jgi:predicted TIM-barrel fold metal-dependent hydrolase
MIIDCHTHIGTILTFDMPEVMLLTSMDKYHIDYALVSNIEGSEVDGNLQPIPPEQQFSQRAVNQKTLDLARAHPDRLGALLWIKPVTEGCTDEFAEMVSANRDHVFGIKVHPYLSNLPFNSPEVERYVQLAERFGLAIVTHTATDANSNPRLVSEVARKYPSVNFVLYHMGITEDSREAIDLIAETPNLYGDCCWVPPRNVLDAIKTCGSDRMLFGTDNPINGPETYDDHTYYQPYFGERIGELAPADFDNFMFRNAIRVFNLGRFTHLLSV